MVATRHGRLGDRLYVVDGKEVHVTQESDGQTACIVLTERDEKVWLQETWFVDMPPGTQIHRE